MARGRKRKLQALDWLDGHPSHSRPFIEDMGIESLGEPFIPEHLIDDARGCVEVIKKSMPPKVYSALDSFLLAAFGTQWAIHKMAAEKIAAPDFEAVGKRGAINRWLTVLDKATGQMLALSDRLGLDPRSRQNLKLPRARQQRSKFADLAAEGAQPSQ